MSLLINKNSIGQKFFVVPCGEMAKYHDTECGYAEMTFLTVGTKYLTITDYKSKDRASSKHDRKFTIRDNIQNKNGLGLQDQMCELSSGFGWSCYVFNDEDVCKAFVAKSALVNRIANNIDIYTLRDVLASKDTETLKILDQIFNNQTV